MAPPPRITDEAVLDRWLSLEIRKMNRGVARVRRPLATLLAETEPATVTNDGSPYRFAPGVLRALAAELPGDLHPRLRLPVLFFASPE